MPTKQQLTDWVLAYSDDGHAAGETVPATVPGMVQLDWAKATGMPSFYQGAPEPIYRWMEDKYWHYTTTVAVADGEEQPVLCLNNVDYSGEVRINGVPVLRHEGLFTPAQADLTAYKGQTVTLEVVLSPAPKREGIEAIRGLGNEASGSCKPAFCYGWDWAPRIVTAGLSGAAYVEYRDAATLVDPTASYVLNDTLDEAAVTVECTARAAGSLTVTVTDETGAAAAQATFETKPGTGTYTLTLKSPRLWWPNGQGDQPVYTLTAVHTAAGREDTFRRAVGFRRIRLVPNEGVWSEDHPDDPTKCPVGAQTQAKAPFTIEINGRRIFAKGSNWVPSEMSYSQLDPARTDTQVRYMKEANMNIVRVWGGGFIYPDFFFDACDRHGIMVWQEFPLACAAYSEEPSYLAVLKQEVTTSVRRLRTHPSLAMWVGGNELFNSWSKMTPQSPAIRLMDSLCYELDPFTPFLPTSPVYGVGHGSYSIAERLPDGSRIEHITVMCQDHFTAYTEFGCGAPSEWNYLATFMSEEELAGSFFEGTYRAHHAKWCSGERENEWLDEDAIRLLTQCGDSHREVIDSGVQLQARMYAMLFEEARRQWPYCSMVANWCYNEPWPTAAGNSLINYPHHRKADYFTVADALREQRLSLQMQHLSWKKGSTVTVTPWVLNTANAPVQAGKATITLVADGEETVLDTWEYGVTAALCNQKCGKEISFTLPADSGRTFELRITAEDASLNGVYTLYALD